MTKKKKEKSNTPHLGQATIKMIQSVKQPFPNPQLYYLNFCYPLSAPGFVWGFTEIPLAGEAV